MSIYKRPGEKTKDQRPKSLKVEEYEVDPLTCPKCASQMRVISVIEDSEIVKKILKHLGLWYQNPPYLRRIKARPPPKVNSPTMTPEYHIDYMDSQLPASDNYLYLDPIYSDHHPA